MNKMEETKFKQVLFWVLSCTWGIVMTLIGSIVALVLIAMGYKPQRFHSLIYFEVGSGWGGVNFGAFFITSKGASLHTRQHESGHGLQNIMLGVFMPFVIAIPSLVRHWYREWLVRSGKKLYSELPAYDSIWFEGWATKLGEKYFAE